jgi:hypothetical protein
MFNKLMGPLIHPSSWGISSLMRRPTTPDLTPAQERILAARLRRKISNIEATWAELDIYNWGRISHSDFQLALRKLGVRNVTDEKSFALMSRFKEPTNTTGEMMRSEFIACMQHLLYTIPPPARGEDKENILASLASANAEVRRVLPGNRASIVAAFGGEGVLSFSELRAALNSAGARLTDAEFAVFAHANDEIDEGNVDVLTLAGAIASDATTPRKDAGGDEEPLPVAAASPRGSPLTATARNTVLMRSLDSYPPWVALGIAPLYDPLTQTRFSLAKMARICMAKTGLSEKETSIVQALVGRRDAFLQKCRAFDRESKGSLPLRDFLQVLEALNVDADSGAVDLLAYRYDAPAHSGKVMGYEAFAAAMTTLLDAPFHPTNPEGALKSIGFETDGTSTLATLRAKVRTSTPSFIARGGVKEASSPAPTTSSVPSPLPSPSQPMSAAPLAFSSHYRVDPKASIQLASPPKPLPTTSVDHPVTPRAAREAEASSSISSYAVASEAAAIVRRITEACEGRRGGWSDLASELLREAEYSASPLSGTARPGGSPRIDLSPLGASGRRDGAPGAATMATLRLGTRSLESRGSSSSSPSQRAASTVIPASVLQRMLAKRGVPLTPRDLRVLSSRFAPATQESGPLSIDLGLLGREIGAY